MTMNNSSTGGRWAYFIRFILWWSMNISCPCWPMKIFIHWCPMNIIIRWTYLVLWWPMNIFRRLWPINIFCHWCPMNIIIHWAMNISHPLAADEHLQPLVSDEQYHPLISDEQYYPPEHRHTNTNAITHNSCVEWLFQIQFK